MVIVHRIHALLTRVVDADERVFMETGYKMGALEVWVFYPTRNPSGSIATTMRMSSPANFAQTSFPACASTSSTSSSR